MQPLELCVPVGRHGEHDNILASLDHSKEKPPILPVPNPTQSFWLQESTDSYPNRFSKAGSESPLQPETDICIIGSGSTGICAAYHLVKLLQDRAKEIDTRITLLEARDFCSGATGRNGGHLTPISFSGFSSIEKAHGTDNALANAALEEHVSSSIQELIQENSWADEVDHVINKRTMLYVCDEHYKMARHDFECATKAGLPNLDQIDWLTKEQVQQSYGASYPAARKPGNNLWPLKLFTKIYEKALEEASFTSVKISLHTWSAVQSIKPSSQPDKRWSVETSRGNISCRYVIHATNAYAAYLLPHLKGPKGIVPTRAQIMATRAAVPKEGLTDSAWTANKGLEYWFPRPTKSPSEGNPLVILGGAREIENHFEFYESDDSVVNPDIGKTLRKFLPQVFPGKFKEGQEPEMEWTGVLGFTTVGDPFVGPVLNPSNPASVEFEGQYIAAGYTGHGMPRTFACAEVVAQMIVSDMEGKQLKDWIKPDWLPDQYLTLNRV